MQVSVFTLFTLGSCLVTACNPLILELAVLILILILVLIHILDIIIFIILIVCFLPLVRFPEPHVSRGTWLLINPSVDGVFLIIISPVLIFLPIMIILVQVEICYPASEIVSGGWIFFGWAHFSTIWCWSLGKYFGQCWVSLILRFLEMGAKGTGWDLSPSS